MSCVSGLLRVALLLPLLAQVGGFQAANLEKVAAVSGKAEGAKAADTVVSKTDLKDVPAPAVPSSVVKAADGLPVWKAAFAKSFVVVAIAEMFDKTWFMSLILAVKHGWQVTLVGAYTGLLLHCVLSALLGFGFAKLLKGYVLHFITAGMFFLFTILYSKDWYEADPDSNLIESGMEEGEEGLGGGDSSTYGSTGSPSAEKKAPSGCFNQLMKSMASASRWVVIQCFISVFIAEWGDRTQFAMIGLHSSLPVVPVFIGSAVAFFVLTGSAVGLASIVAKLKISERTVFAIAAISFGVFGVLALMDGLKELHQAKAAI